MIELSGGRGVNIVYSWEALGKSELLIALSPNVDSVTVLFCFREKQNNPAE